MIQPGSPRSGNIAAGERRAVAGIVRKRRTKTARGNAGYLNITIFDRQAGYILQKVAEITAGDVPERVGGDNVFDIRGGPLFVGRNFLRRDLSFIYLEAL